MADSAPKSDLDEIRGLMTALPPQAEAAAAAWRARAASLIRPRMGLGALETYGPWLAATRGTDSPKLDRPRLALFAASHGVGESLPGGLGAVPVAEEIARINAGLHPTSILCAKADAELRLYELALEAPCSDAGTGPAMSEDEAARAMAYGMMAVEEGVDLIVLADCSAGAEPSWGAQAITFLGRKAGLDSWLDGASERALALRAAERVEDLPLDPFALLAELGGYDSAAMAGLLIAARMGRVPVLLDGTGPLLAALALDRARAGSMAHCALAQKPRTALEREIAAELGFDKAVLPVSDIALGRGAAGALAVPLLQALVRVQADTASFGG